VTFKWSKQYLCVYTCVFNDTYSILFFVRNIWKTSPVVLLCYTLMNGLMAEWIGVWIDRSSLASECSLYCADKMWTKGHEGGTCRSVRLSFTTRLLLHFCTGSQPCHLRVISGKGESCEVYPGTQSTRCTAEHGDRLIIAS